MEPWGVAVGSNLGVFLCSVSRIAIGVKADGSTRGFQIGTKKPASWRGRAYPEAWRKSGQSFCGSTASWSSGMGMP